MENLFDLSLCYYLLCRAGITTLMSISDGLDPYFFHRKVEKTRSMKEEMDGRVSISLQSWYFSFLKNMVKVLFRKCTLKWRVINFVSHQAKGVNRRIESNIFIRSKLD